MGLALAVCHVYLPVPVRKRRLNELFRATAVAFRFETPQLKGYDFDSCLREFALFTAANAEQCIQKGTQKGVKERLYDSALKIGQNIREELNIQTPKEVMQAAGIIYKALKIDFHGDTEGRIVIAGCFFRSFYSGNVCRVISSLDEGLMAGLSGGLKLEFEQRITEGNTCCKAHLLPPGVSQ